MPGKKGERMIARLSTSKKFHSVRELVFSLFESSPNISKEECEKLVKKEYPKANFMGKDGRSGHFTWYKHTWNRMKLENANFNLKEAHAKKEEVPNESTTSDESQKDSTTGTEEVVAESVEKDSSGGKGRRVPIQPKKRKVVVKTGKTVLQRKGSPKSSGRNPKATKVPH